MAETKNQGKATMIQFAARPIKNNFIAAAADGETKAAEEIPTMKSIKDGRETLAIGQYFKVLNDKPWKYYQKTSAKGAKKLKEAEFTDGPIKTSIRNGLETLEIGKYFKVKNGDDFKYYQKTSAKGAKKVAFDIEKTLADLNSRKIAFPYIKKTLDDLKGATTTTDDYMTGEITGIDVPLYIQNRDMIAVEKNTKFCASQLLDTARIFKSLVGYQRVKGIVTNSTGTDKQMEYEMPYLLNQTENDNGTYYHHRATIDKFIRIFDGIEVNMSPNGGLSTPPLSHTMTFKTQKYIKRGRSLIYINDLKKNMYSFLMSETRTVEGRSKKLESIQNKKEGLLLLVIACSIGLPTRKFTKAFEFFEKFTKKYTVVNDNNIIRTLLHLNGIYVDGVREYGNRALELWELYKKEFPHFKTTYDDDDDNIKTLYSYPTATELRYLVIRAEKVITNILDGVDLDEDSEESLPKKKKSQGVKDTLTASDDPDTDDDREGVNESPEEKEKRLKATEKKAAAIAGTPSAPQTNGEGLPPPEQKTADNGGNLFSKKPLNFLMSI
tara:strand:+ start:460 stop:2112 length:1653 start_codon:yes stop_codon:yes gene_type:complete